MLQFILLNEERKGRFVRGGKDKHVAELCVGGSEDVGDNETLPIEDVIKRLCALYSSRNADSGRLQNFRLVNLLFLCWPGRPHVTVFALHSLRGEG